MTRLIVIEHKGEGLSREIARRIGKTHNVTEPISVIGASSPDELTLGGTDILVVSPGYCAPPESTRSRLRCRILLLPGGKCADFADADCVVTYGMHPKDTITLSSIGETDCVVALQRELITACGEILDRQELVIHGVRQADKLLAVCGALLVSGINPIF